MAASRFSDMASRYVICIIGDWKSLEDIDKLAQEYNGEFILDREYSILEADDRMIESFAASVDRVNPTFNEKDVAAIKTHNAVAYVITESTKDELLISMAEKSLEFIQRCFKELNALAIKVESAGIAHGKDGWLDLHKNYTKTQDVKYLYQAFVRRPITYNPISLYTCGMHLLGMPDILIKLDGFTEELEAVELLDKAAAIILDKQGEGDEFISEINDWDEEYNQVKLIPCIFYEEDEFFYNPFGLVYLSEDNDEDED